eukprot:11206958-Lingulodinium_polyedra.AAC.1
MVNGSAGSTTSNATGGPAQRSDGTVTAPAWRARGRAPLHGHRGNGPRRALRLARGPWARAAALLPG